jgi:hypothetical protein
MATRGSMVLIATVLAAVPALPAAAATQYDFAVVSAGGTITSDINGSWDANLGVSENPATGEPYPRKSTGTAQTTVTWKANPKNSSAVLPLPSIANATKGTAMTINLRGVTGSAAGSLNVTLGDGKAISCAPAGVALSRAFFSDSAANDIFIRLFGKGSPKAYLSGGFPWHAFSGNPCSDGLSGLSWDEETQTYATIPRGQIVKAKKGKKLTLVLTHRASVVGKIDGAKVTAGTITWKTTLVLRLRSAV